jgi:hypothetical protein
MRAKIHQQTRRVWHYAGNFRLRLGHGTANAKDSTHTPTGSIAMNNLVLNFPTFGFVVATRAMLGVGIGLLIADRLPADRRRAIGLTLVGIGAATTLPAAVAVLRARRTRPELGDANANAPDVPAVM